MFGPAESECVDIIEAPEGCGRILKPPGLTGPSNLPVDLEPVLLERRHDLADPSSNRVRDAGLLLKDPIDFQKAEIHRVVRVIEQYLDRAETFVDRIKQGSVLLLRLAQPPVGCFRLPSSHLFTSQKLLTLRCCLSRSRNVASDGTHTQQSPGFRVADRKVLVGYRDRFLSLPMPEVRLSMPATLLDRGSDDDIGTERALIRGVIIRYLRVLDGIIRRQAHHPAAC